LDAGAVDGDLRGELVWVDRIEPADVLVEDCAEVFLTKGNGLPLANLHPGREHDPREKERGEAQRDEEKAVFEC